MLPLAVWQQIIRSVRQQYPTARFLLEGLGGAWEATENLLNAGGMEYAYSELFQEFGAESITATSLMSATPQGAAFPRSLR